MFTDYLPTPTFSALRLLCRAMARQHNSVDVDTVADIARLTLSRSITTAHVVRAAELAGLEVTR